MSYYVMQAYVDRADTRLTQLQLRETELSEAIEKAQGVVDHLDNLRRGVQRQIRETEGVIERGMNALEGGAE